MNTDELIERLELLRETINKKDEDIIKIAIHRLKIYKKIINKLVREEVRK